MYSSILDLKTPLARTQDEAMFPEQWDGLVAAWPMLEGGGEAAFDFSGMSAHGTLINNPTWSPAGLTLNSASSQYIFIPDASQLDGFQNGMSVVVWATFASLSSSQNILAKYNSATNQRSYSFIQENSGFLRWAYTSDGTASTFGHWDTDNAVLTAGKRHCIVIVHREGVIDFFVDGLQKPSTTISGPSPGAIHAGSANLAIGALTGGGSYFNGTMFGAILYSRPLLSSEAMAFAILGPNSYLIPRRLRSEFAAQLAAANRRRRLLTACG